MIAIEQESLTSGIFVETIKIMKMRKMEMLGLASEPQRNSQVKLISGCIDCTYSRVDHARRVAIAHRVTGHPFRSLFFFSFWIRFGGISFAEISDERIIGG